MYILELYFVVSDFSFRLIEKFLYLRQLVLLMSDFFYMYNIVASIHFELNY